MHIGQSERVALENCMLIGWLFCSFGGKHHHGKAFPTDQTYHGVDRTNNEMGVNPSLWVVWTQAQWTKKEKRHGHLLHKYLYLNSHIDMKQFHKTI
jgi:hypothetical protein